MKTLLGTEIPETTRAVFYVCKFNHEQPSITVVAEQLFDNAQLGFDTYANTPNPESQIVLGRDYEQLVDELIKLHWQMQQEKWLEDLADSL
jgi:hypothetical protein